MGEVSLPWENADLSADMGRKQVALVAILAIQAGPVPREELARLLWPQSDRQAARHNLRQALVSIRKALGARADATLIADPDGVVLRQDTVRTDIQRLREISAGAETSAAEVLDLCRGQLLDGFSLASPAFEERLELWRQQTARLAIRAIDSALDRASPGQREALLAKRRIFTTGELGEAARPPRSGPSAAAAPAPRRRFAHSWHRTLVAVVAGLSLGTALMLAAFAASPAVRGWMRSTLVGGATEVPSIAVRPFRSMNAAQFEQNLAGGVTVGVTYGLYAVTARELFVVTVPAEDEFDGISGAEYAADLGVRYLISGTVEHDGGTVRVFVRCFDAQLGADVWQDRFTSPVTEAFQLQDDITLRILQGLEIDLGSAERNRIQYLDDTENLEAWLLAVNGVSNLIKLAPGRLDEAIASYRRALEIDPEYISARRGVVWHALSLARFGMADDPEAAIQEARNHLNVIMRRAPDDGMSKALEGFLLLLENSWDKAIEAGEASSTLLPGSADVWAVLAHSYTYVGENEKALDAIERAKRLSPAHPRFYDWIEARARRQLGETERAIELLDQDVRPDEETLVRLVELAAAYMAAGRTADALATATQIREIDPDFRASTWVLHPAMQDPDLQSLEFELLSKAGL